MKSTRVWSGVWVAVMAVVAAAACVPELPPPPDPCPASQAPPNARWFTGTEGSDLIQIDNAGVAENIAVCLKGGNDLVELMDGAVFDQIMIWGGGGDDRVVDGTALGVFVLGPSATFQRIDADLGDGADLIHLDARLQGFDGVYVTAGVGNDVVWFGQSFAAASRGTAVIDAGDGNDVVRVNYRSVNIATGDGADLVDLAGGNIADFAGFESSANRQVLLGEGDDNATGSLANDRISGGGGDDLIVGGGTYRFTGLGFTGPEPDVRSETLFGDADDDTIRHRPTGIAIQLDAVIASGGTGNDTIDTTSTNVSPQVLWVDNVDGGDGVDTCSIDPSDLATNC